MTEKPQAIFDAVKPICDWRMGKDTTKYGA